MNKTNKTVGYKIVSAWTNGYHSHQLVHTYDEDKEDFVAPLVPIQLIKRNYDNKRKGNGEEARTA